MTLKCSKQNEPIKTFFHLAEPKLGNANSWTIWKRCAPKHGREPPRIISGIFILYIEVKILEGAFWHFGNFANVMTSAPLFYVELLQTYRNESNSCYNEMLVCNSKIERLENMCSYSVFGNSETGLSKIGTLEFCNFGTLELWNFETWKL